MKCFFAMKTIIYVIEHRITFAIHTIFHCIWSERFSPELLTRRSRAYKKSEIIDFAFSRSKAAVIVVLYGVFENILWNWFVSWQVIQWNRSRGSNKLKDQAIESVQRMENFHWKSRKMVCDFVIKKIYFRKFAAFLHHSLSICQSFLFDFRQNAARRLQRMHKQSCPEIIFCFDNTKNNWRTKTHCLHTMIFDSNSQFPKFFFCIS